jgi:hypothetical protein
MPLRSSYFRILPADVCAKESGDWIKHAELSES